MFTNPSGSRVLSSKYVEGARRGLTAPKNVKPRIGPSKETGSVTSFGAVVTSVVKRTSTGRSSPFRTKDSESEPRNCFLLA